MHKTLVPMEDRNPDVDVYFSDGCGRCPLGGTADCKVHAWREALLALRMLVLECGLREERKWGVPCYTSGGANVVMLGAFKGYCTLSFVKGALLQDPEGLLMAPGENSRSVRVARFTEAASVFACKDRLQQLIREAVGLQQRGMKVPSASAEEAVLPEELVRKMEESPALKAAFESLTPGRRRGYLLHFNAAKQSKTREGRIEKHVDRILSGKGLMDP